MSVPVHHKEIVMYLLGKIGEPVSVVAYRDNNNQRPIAIGKFGSGVNALYSTIGISDKSLNIPQSNLEFMLIGKHSWLPNALASSLYWLESRECLNWPLVCEDVVKQNTRSTFRHILYIPSEFTLELTSGYKVNWLLGLPIKDSEISMGIDEAILRAKAIYPAWLFM